MYRVRLWSVRNARWLNRGYDALERVLLFLYPLLRRIGYTRVEAVLFPVEKALKEFLFDSQSCGQCSLGNTGMACPMNCPKAIRNGPCGGVRADGSCEIDPAMICVWVSAWEGSQRVRDGLQAIQQIQPPVDVRLRGSSAWLRALRRKYDDREGGPGAF